MLCRSLTFCFFFLTSLIVHGAELTALTYHDIVPDPGDDGYTISRSEFAAHLDYLQSNGYQPVNLDLLDQVRKDRARLPAKAVLLTFDDGLKSYHDFVVPLLKKYGYPSVVSIVTGWLDGKNVPPEYRRRLMDWNDVQALDRLPLVEVVSHSHNLHHSIRSNPMGNKAPAGITREYLQFRVRYETEAEFRQRIRKDLSRSVQRIKQQLGDTPRAISWPYGYYDRVLIEEAAALGMIIHLTLDNEPASVKDLPRIRRIVITRPAGLTEFSDSLHYRDYRTEQQRFVELSLEPFRRASPLGREQLLSKLLNRLEWLGVNTVIVSPFSDDLSEALFPTSEMPVAGDILNRVLHQMAARLRIRNIYLRIPSALAAKNPRVLFRQLARLHRFNGVVIDGPIPQKALHALKRTFRYFRPAVKFGAFGTPSKTEHFDFFVLPVHADGSLPELVKRITHLSSPSVPLLVLLRNEKDINSRQLEIAMYALRTAGVKHYGYGRDNYLQRQSGERSLASALTAESLIHEYRN